MKKKFIIHTKFDKVLIEAEDRDHAFAKYFYDIINEKVTLDKLGGIIMLRDENAKNEGDEIGFRTAPLLWKMGVIGTQHAISNICSLTGATHKEAKDMLKNAADSDARLIPLIEELRLAEDDGEDTLLDGMRRGMQK